MIEPDPYEHDPFFKRVFDSDWNACIGRQGFEENYLDGYIEAAIELADAVTRKRDFAKRDTLVLPILYNARHAVELTLKFATNRLAEAGAIKRHSLTLSHNIKVYYGHLRQSAIGDKELSATIVGLGPYVESFSLVDSDGQEMRYHRDRAGSPSLASHATANLKLIRSSLGKLEKMLSTLQHRTVDFLAERATGSFTNCCSRTDLFAIARLIPRRDEWGSDVFEECKQAVKMRYGLSNRQFSLALDQIQASREMRGILGLESSLLHLTDDEIVWVVGQWRRVHPQRQAGSDEEELDYFDADRFEIRKQMVLRQDVVEAIASRLSADSLADLEAMFYLERDRIFSDYYEQLVKRIVNEHEKARSPKSEVSHLIDKTNFLQCIRSAAARLGRLSLSERLMVI